VFTEFSDLSQKIEIHVWAIDPIAIEVDDLGAIHHRVSSPSSGTGSFGGSVGRAF
jgi:hypothetical protein